MSITDAVMAAIAMVAFFALFAWLLWKATEADTIRSPWVACLALVSVAGLAFLIYMAAAEEASGPCLRKETRPVLVGKTVVPMEVCVERGKWVDER